MQNRRRTTYGRVGKNTVLLLHFDNNVNDSSSLNNATIQSTVSYVEGKFSSGALLDKSTGYFTKDISAITGLSDWTIEFWYKDIDTVKTNSTGIFTTGAFEQRSPWVGLRYMADYYGGLYLFISDGATTITTDFGAISSSLDNNWHHYAIVYKSGIVFIYLDGVLKTSKNCHLSIPNFGSQLTTGTYSNNYTRWMHGVLDEFRISNIARYTANFTPPTAPLK